MSETILVALVTGGLALAGTFLSNRKSAVLIAYRLEQLEKKLGIAFKPLKGGDKPAPAKKKAAVKKNNNTLPKKTASKNKKHTNRQGKRKATAK